MKTIYEVRYGTVYGSDTEFVLSTDTVLADDDAQVAIDKVRKHVTKDKKVKAFRLYEVKILAEAEL